jgi:hypothetical protein
MPSGKCDIPALLFSGRTLISLVEGRSPVNPMNKAATRRQGAYARFSAWGYQIAATPQKRIHGPLRTIHAGL